MPRQAKGISAAKVAKGRPGRYGDGDGLYLTIRSPTSKFWSFRYVRADKMTEIGLGPAVGRKAVTLSEARQKARALWDIHKEGRDPLAERKAGRTAITAAGSRSFQEAADDFIATYRASWRNPASVRQWRQSLEDYAYPVIGRLNVADVATAHVVQVLQPIWNGKTETADRVRGRIEQILDREKVLGHRTGENPARWRGHLSLVLPRHAKKAKAHHAAMPVAEIGDFMAKLRADPDRAAQALELTILCATRTGETLGARWDEINLDEKLWVIPPARMKAGREHRVPLSSRAVEILRTAQATRTDDFVFPSRLKNRSQPLSPSMLYNKVRAMGCDCTVHGFRSTFRDWAAGHTNFPREIAEMALAHVVGDGTEQAYRRSDALQKRYQLAEAWGAFCSRPSIKANGKTVVPIRGGTK
jgi:integrase